MLLRHRKSRSRARSRAFTFIELIVAVGLSIVLIRGMFIVFHSATDLTTLSEEKSELLLEASAIYEFLSRDLARAPYSGTRSFTTGSGELIFKATGLSGGNDVYIKYEFSGGKLTRGVYSDSGCGTGVDEDGVDGADTGMVISSKLSSFTTSHDTSGGSTRAVQCEFKLKSSMLDSSALDDNVKNRLTTFMIAFPVMSM